MWQFHDARLPVGTELIVVPNFHCSDVIFLCFVNFSVLELDSTLSSCNMPGLVLHVSLQWACLILASRSSLEYLVVDYLYQLV